MIEFYIIYYRQHYSEKICLTSIAFKNKDDAINYCKKENKEQGDIIFNLYQYAKYEVK